MNESEIIEGILLYLSKQPPLEKVPLSDLLKALTHSSPEPVIEALHYLKDQQLIEMLVAGHKAMLCWLTYNGRKIAKEILILADMNSAVESTPATDSHIIESEIEAIEEYPEFSWTLEGLDQKRAEVVQRQNVVERIQKILENASDNRIAFVYGSAQVGKTFVLNRLKNTLPNEYVSVFIHLNGWQSISKLSTFLYELATYLETCPEFGQCGYQIQPFTPSSEIEATRQFSKFMNQLVQKVRDDGKYLVLMFDELEYLTKEDTDKEIFRYLTNYIETYSQQEVRFVFAGSGHMVNLVRGGSLARFWVKGGRVEIKSFKTGTSRALIVALTARYFQFDTKAIERIIRLGNGHPNFLRRTLPILVDYWKNKWRRNIITENDLNDVLQEICFQLSPELRDIWSRLSLLEQQVLQRIARIRCVSFRIDEVTIGSEPKIKRCLDQLVWLQILDYVKRDNLYIVRLGLIIESLSYGILFVRSENHL